MRGGTVSEWADFFGIGVDDLVAHTRALARRASVLDEEVVALRMVFQDGPDGELARALARLERCALDVGTMIRALHGYTYLDRT